MADQFRPFEAFRSTCNFSSNIWSSRGCSESTNTKFYSVDSDCRWVASKLSSWTWRSQNIQVCAVTALGLILSDKSRLQNGFVQFLLGPWNACLFILFLLISNGPIATRCSVGNPGRGGMSPLPMRWASPVRERGRWVALFIRAIQHGIPTISHISFQIFEFNIFFWWLSNWVSLLQGWCYRKKTLFIHCFVAVTLITHLFP